MLTVSRLFIVLLLTLGILAPRASAIVVDLMPGQFQTVVICSGSEMQTIVIDAEGNAVEIVDAEAHKCVFSDNALASETPETPLWQVLARIEQHDWLHRDLVLAHTATAPPPPSQGPPLPV